MPKTLDYYRWVAEKTKDANPNFAAKVVDLTEGIVQGRKALMGSAEAFDVAYKAAAEALRERVAELEVALRRVMEESGTSQLQYKIAEAALKGDEAK